MSLYCRSSCAGGQHDICRHGRNGRMSPCFVPSIWSTKLVLFPQGQTRSCMTSVGRLHYGVPLLKFSFIQVLVVKQI